MKRLLLILAGFFFLFRMEAQTLKAYLRAAESAYAAKDYYSALRFYGISLEIEEKRPDLWFRLGECARELSAFPLADSAYTQVLLLTDSAQYGIALYHLATVKKEMGDYMGAQELFFEFASRSAGAADSLASRSVQLAEECTWANEVVSKPSTAFDIESLDSIGTLINTPYSEFGPSAVKGDTIYYTSFSFVWEGDEYDPPRPYMKMLRSVNGAPGEIFKAIDTDSLHNAYLVFNPQKTRVYYSLCQYTGTTDIRCELYYREVLGADSLGAAVRLPAPVNLEGYTASQPAIGYNREMGKEYLFFVSDRPGSAGETDIWASEIRKDGNFGQPENLRALNTPGSEVTPFFHENSQALYFSSNGLQGLGGYDIYKSMPIGLVWSAPEHIQPPVNSNFNEVYYSLSVKGDKGYFSSNRDGSVRYADVEEFCCFDIYKFYKAVFQLNVFTFNAKTREELAAVDLELYALVDGKPVLVDSGKNPDGNDFGFQPEVGRVYVLYGNKDGYLTALDTIDLTNPQGEREVDVNLYLPPTSADLLVRVFDVDTKMPLLGTTVRLVEMDVPVEEKINDAGNEFEFPLDRKKKYAVVVSRPGYDPQTIPVPDFDPANPEFTVNLDVYLKRNTITLEALVYDKITEQPLFGSTIEIWEDGEQTVVEPLPTSNEYRGEINKYKTYVVVASKAGYHPDTIRIQIDPKENISVLSKKLFLVEKTISEYVPLFLYFDNDEPDPKVSKTTTTKEYGETYLKYYDRKDTYLTELAKISPEEEFFSDSLRVEAFFERNVRESYENLNLFTSKILVYLQKGIKVKVTITGFASPRGTSDYNLRLSGRRINSLRNFYNRYEGGILKPFIANGTLIIEEVQKGDKEVPEEVREKLKKDRDSIYSPLAAQARRVEIIGITIEEGR